MSLPQLNPEQLQRYARHLTLPEFGVRCEVNVYIDQGGGVHVTGGPLQTEIRRILL